MQTMYIGIDIGGTNIRIGVTETLDEPKLIETLIFPNTSDYVQNEQHIIEVIRQVGSKVDGIGISIMGYLDEAKTTVLSAGAAPRHSGLINPLPPRYERHLLAP
jgi:predicted NBD/HSP70 family sugar kinase